MRIIDRVFGMEGGCVLEFSNRTFAEFFRDEIQEAQYARNRVDLSGFCLDSPIQSL